MRQSDGESCSFTLEFTVRQIQVRWKILKNSTDRLTDETFNQCFRRVKMYVLHLYLASNSKTGFSRPEWRLSRICEWFTLNVEGCLVSVCSVSSCHSRQTDDDQIYVWSKLKSHWIITVNCKMNVWKCKPIFPTDTTAKEGNNLDALRHTNEKAAGIHIAGWSQWKTFAWGCLLILHFKTPLACSHWFCLQVTHRHSPCFSLFLMCCPCV